MLVSVQILRAVAATMVVWHHARHEVGLLAERVPAARWCPGRSCPGGRGSICSS
ncbi:hypothetical protein ACFQFG_19865 [Methylobacterium persicinum]